MAWIFSRHVTFHCVIEVTMVCLIAICPAVIFWTTLHISSVTSFCITDSQRRSLLFWYKHYIPTYVLVAQRLKITDTKHSGSLNPLNLKLMKSGFLIPFHSMANESLCILFPQAVLWPDHCWHSQSSLMEEQWQVSISR